MAAFTPLKALATRGPAPCSTATAPASSVITTWSSKKAQASWVIGSKGRPKGREGRAVKGVGMAHGENVRMFLMHRRMKHKAGPVHRVVAFDNRAFVVHQNQV